ncbi:MAG: hypothetical protein WBJ83_06910 [Thermacetogeniaceae bacterium]|jgi:hypothetical protein
MSLEVKQNLTDKQLAILNSEMEKHKRSVGLAYVLYIFFGSIGVQGSQHFFGQFAKPLLKGARFPSASATVWG